MWSQIREFWAQPFKPEMSAFDWFLFFGLVLIIMIMWRIILGHILYGVGQGS